MIVRDGKYDGGLWAHAMERDEAGESLEIPIHAPNEACRAFLSCTHAYSTFWEPGKAARSIELEAPVEDLDLNPRRTIKIFF